jgi:hypothetical protein
MKVAKRKAVSDKKIVRIYKATGSIRKTAKKVARVYMTIWLRLHKLGLR